MELIQFRFSPYNEKVRWALDVKRVAHSRRAVLPGPHLPTVKKLTGRTQTPVLITPDGAKDGSAAIIAWLEANFPSPALYPSDDTARKEAIRIEQWFDCDIAPRIRRAVLASLLASPAYFARVFGDGRSRWVQRAYALTVPMAAPLVRKSNGISGAAAITDGKRAAHEALDFVATHDGFLVGNQFSVADIAAASVLAMVVDPPNSPMTRPLPHGTHFAALVNEFAAHNGARWVNRMYATQRSAKTDFEGRSDY